MSKLRDDEITKLEEIRDKLEEARKDPNFIKKMKDHFAEKKEPVKGKDGVYRMDTFCIAVKDIKKISITVRGLVMCPEWRSCRLHSGKYCREIELHNKVIELFKLKRANRENALKGLAEFISKEVK